MKKKEYTIKIPHLNYVVVVEPKKKSDYPLAGAYSQRMADCESKIVCRLPIRGKITASDLVHEIIHVLQFIVEDHNMTFIKEREHLAYIAGYLFDEVCKLK